MRKKILLAFLLLLSVSFLFSGCDYTKNEIKNRLIVQAIGVDATENGVRVTLQTLNTDMAGNPNSGANLGDVISSITAEGENLSDAISNVSKTVGRKPLLSQNRLIVFGRETAEKGLYPFLDYFVRSTENRATVLLALSDTTAEEVVSAKMGESILPANSLEDLFYARRFNAQIVKEELFSFVNRLEDENTDAFLPMIKAEKKEEEGKFTLDSVGVFKGDALSYEIKDDAVTALLLLNNQLEGGFFTVENPEFQALSTAQIQSSKTKIHTKLEKNKPHYSICVKMTIDLIENQSKMPSPTDKSFISSTKSLCEARVEKMITENLESCFKEKNSDPYRLFRRLSLEHPFYYKKNQQDFKDKLPEISYDVSVEVKISHIGNGTENI